MTNIKATRIVALEIHGGENLMPFDFRAVAARTIAKPVSPSLLPFAPGHQGLRNLAYLLRTPALWPDHKWDFSQIDGNHLRQCGTAGCAIGLARQVWPEVRECTSVDNQDALPIAKLFDMSWDDAANIFLFRKTYGHDAVVTPGMVADQIDAYLTRTSPTKE